MHYNTGFQNGFFVARLPDNALFYFKQIPTATRNFQLAQVAMALPVRHANSVSNELIFVNFHQETVSRNFLN